MALWVVRSHLIAKPGQFEQHSFDNDQRALSKKKKKENVPSKNEMKDFEMKVTSKLWSEKWNSIVTWVRSHYLRVFLKSSFSFLRFLWNTWLHLGEQGWRSTGESVRLPPMWPGLINNVYLMERYVETSILLLFVSLVPVSGSELFEEGSREAPVRVPMIDEQHSPNASRPTFCLSHKCHALPAY